ncbi:MAG: sugar ABC transporter [Euryarchaeota archaeon]|nr:sugar ABC transporter [Euryarchaeota archaeon]
MSDNRGLVVKNVSKTYGNTRVLNNVSFEVKPGEVVALLGENGAGKSTVSGIIAGSVTPDQGGEMEWKGEEYKPNSPGYAIQKGIGLIHQETRLLRELSVTENVFVGKLLTKNGLVDFKTMNNIAKKQLNRLGLDISPNQLVRNLKMSAQQQIEIAKALCLNSELLIMDEPTSSLGETETNFLFDKIRQLKNEGVAFIYISHRLEEIEQIADKIIVFRDGNLITKYDNARIAIDTIVNDMVGRDVDRIFPEITNDSSKEVLKVDNLNSFDGSFENINFDLKKGEILGIAGLVGAGRTEIIRSICGADKLKSGNIFMEGKNIKVLSPEDAIKNGIVMVPEDRKSLGLLLDQSNTQNLTISNFDVFLKNGWVWPRLLKSFAIKAIKFMGVKGNESQNVHELSGGNQQKLLISKWISRQPKVLILDEPTRGIDVGARHAIYEIIKKIAENGLSIIIVSSDLEEVIGLSHRILVLSRGKQKKILDNINISRVEIMKMATN